MSAIALSDEALSSLLALATPLPIEHRDVFLRAVADRLAILPLEQRGDGSIALIGRQVQSELLVPPIDWQAHPAKWERRARGRPPKAVRATG